MPYSHYQIPFKERLDKDLTLKVKISHEVPACALPMHA
jgi:hypothetical protein